MAADKLADPDAIDPRARPNATDEQRASLLYESVRLWALQKADHAKDHVAFGFDEPCQPFDRAEVHLIRKGGKSPSEHVEALKVDVGLLLEILQDAREALMVCDDDTSLVAIGKIDVVSARVVAPKRAADLPRARGGHTGGRQPPVPTPTATQQEPDRTRTPGRFSQLRPYTHCPEHGTKLIKGRCPNCDSPFNDDDGDW